MHTLQSLVTKAEASTKGAMLAAAPELAQHQAEREADRLEHQLHTVAAELPQATHWPDENAILLTPAEHVQVWACMLTGLAVLCAPGLLALVRHLGG
jgi:hypothetical protein